MNKRMGRVGWGCLVLMVGLLMAGESQASLFCVVDFSGKRCQFGDLDSCRRAAGKQGGCVLNEAEIAKPFGGSPFCLVESWRTECVYMSMAACEKRAQTTRTVCMANPNGGGMGHSPFGNQVPQGGVAAARMPPGMGTTGGFPGGMNLPSSGGVGSTYLPSPGYWPGIDH